MINRVRIARAFLIAWLTVISSSAPATQRAAALSPLAPGNVKFQLYATGLTRPVTITNAADGSGRLFIVEQTGTIRVVKNGLVLATPFLDIHTLVRYNAGEQGLLGLAFDPAYPSNGHFFVAYTAPRPLDSTGSILTLERFSVSAANADQADPATGTIILTIDHPTNSNHNGGDIAFGPDGYLYWGTGDGGSGGDPPGNAQNLSVLLGKLLRIDVESGSPYSIPSTNPFFGSATVRQEVWAYGLRNPWRFSFDRLTGELYIADVGQNLMEEIDHASAGDAGGENYGWNILEGTLCFNSSNFNVPLSSCDTSGKTPPVAEYDHSLGRCAVSGGYVYRGPSAPALRGYYFYADFCSGAVYALNHDSVSGWTVTALATTGFGISTFGEDEGGELYLADLNAGNIYRLRYALPAVASDFDADFKTDPTVFQKAAGNWFTVASSAGFLTPALNFGNSTSYIPVPGDYDADGKVDPAVFEKATGNWYVVGSSRGFFTAGVGFGNDANFIPVPGDYNGDGRTDVAIFEKVGGNWYAKDMPPLALNFGNSTDYIPVPADYDGDGRTDPAVFEKATGNWFVLGSQVGFFTPALNFGNASNYIPVPGDYDGDGKTDPAVYETATGNWFAVGSKRGFFSPALNFGGPGYTPVPGDYDGDGRIDAAVFEQATGNWFVVGSSAGFFTPALNFGTGTNYLPITGPTR